MDMEALEKMFSMHISECDKRDERNAKTFERLESVSRGIWNTIDSLKRWVYMGLGIALSLPTLIEILHFLKGK